MGTQAVVSIVRDGQTVIKCVTGCNGGQAEELAKAIASRHLLTIEDVYAAAGEVYYGCIDCTVVQDKDRIVGAGAEDDDMADSLYVTKFADPHFNPRWSYGTAAHVFLVDADTWQIIEVQ